MSRPDAVSPIAVPPNAESPATAPRLAVRRARVSDAAAYARMMSHPEVYASLLQMPYATPEQWEARLAESCALGSPHVQLVVEATARSSARRGCIRSARRRASATSCCWASASSRPGTGVASAAC